MSSILKRSFRTSSFPERFRRTLLEKWMKYWRSVVNDYNEVAWGVIKSIRERPKRAFGHFAMGYGLYQTALRNPDEQIFMERFGRARNEIIMVDPELRNPVATEYLKRLQLDINQNRQRFLSLGILTIMWEDLYDKDDCTYPAQCEYTKVTFWNFHKYVLDVGFWNRFWLLEWKLRNYDVNYL